MTMHTLVEKPKAGSQALRAKSPTPVSEHFGRNRGLASAASSPFEHDLSRIPIRPGVMGAFQAKLAINEPGDRYEQEADRVSEQVMRAESHDGIRAAPPAIQRLCTGCGEDQDEEKALQRRAEQGRESVDEGPIPRRAEAAVDAVSGGQPLTREQRSFFEPRFGADFSQVRIHAGGSADSAARAVGALAYTRGRDIVFRSDQHNPGTTAGGRLLAHELTHVVQQGAATQRSQGGPAKAGAAAHIHRQLDPQPQPLPGQELDPPGDCGWARYLLLKLNVEVAKNIVDEVGGCEKGDDCLVLAIKIAAASGEIAARVVINETCFRGGDDGHKEQIEIKLGMLKTCYKIFSDKRKNCSDSLLQKAFFAVEQIRLLIASAVAPPPKGAP